MFFSYFAENPSTTKRKAENMTDESTEEMQFVKSKHRHFPCPHCTAVFSVQKNLKHHVKDVHDIDCTPMVCIDVRNGIYVKPKYGHSHVFPIHVIKSTTSQPMDCEIPKCRKCMQIAWLSGNPGKECAHLERTSKAKPCIKPAVLTCESLQDMMSKGLMSSDWGDKWDNLNTAARQCGVDSVFPVFVEDGEQSKRWHFFSRFTSESGGKWWECGGFSRGCQAP